MEKIEKKEKMKRIVIHHHDPDGLTSASLVQRALGSVERFVSQDPNEPFPIIEADEIYVVDIAITEKTYGSLKNLYASRIVWIDHHKPYSELSTLTVPENVQIILDPSAPSAVGLVRKFFGLNDEIAEKITDLGTKADTWQLDTEVQEWMDIDSAFSYYQKDKTPLIQRLAEGKLEITGDIKEVLEKYRTEKEKAKEELVKNTIVKEIKGHTFAFAFAPDIVSGSEAGDTVLKATNTEVQIIIKQQGWVSFRRRKDSSINLLVIAKIFGGGGHEYASGATLGNTVTSANFKTVVEEMAQKIAQVL